MGLVAPRETIEVAMGAQRFELRVGGPAASPEGAAYVEVIGHGVSAAALGVAASKSALSFTEYEAASA